MSKKKLFNIDKNDLMFNNKVLFALLIPIVIEQLLNSFMGMVDTIWGVRQYQGCHLSIR